MKSKYDDRLHSEKMHLVTKDNVKDKPFPLVKIIITVFVVIIIIFFLFLNYEVLYKPHQKKIKSIQKCGKGLILFPSNNTCYSTVNPEGANYKMEHFKKLNNSFAYQKLTQIPEGSIFVVKDGELPTDQDACSIEAALRAFPQKKVCLLELSCGNNTKFDGSGTPNFTHFLQSRYVNFMPMSINGEKYFKGSPIASNWECNNDLSLFGAMALTTWIKGGAAISPEIIVIRPEAMYTNNTLVSKFVIITSKKGSEFLYDFMKGIKTKCNEDVEKYIEQKTSTYSIRKKSNETHYINRTHICDHPKKYCDFLVTEELKKYSGAWLINLRKLCPDIVQNFQENIRNSTK